MQDVERGIVVADQHGLGDLQFQPARRQAGGGQRRDDLQRQRAASELNRRDVDRELDVVGPGRGLGAGRGQHPFAELVDQAGLFGDRDEFGGRDHAALGMPPAQQRFAAGDPVVLQADAGLVVDFERPVGDRLAQIDFQHAARLDVRVHGRLEEAPGAAAGRFGGIHRQIGVLQDLIEVGAVLRAPARCRCWRRWSPGDRDIRRARGSHRRPASTRSVTSSGSLTAVWTMANSSPPSRATKSALPMQRPRRRGHRFQQFVADHVAERIVDALEFVDVDVEHRQLLVRRRSGQFLPQPFVEQARGWAGRSARRNAPDA